MIYESQKGNLTAALAGDATIHRNLSRYREDQFLALVKLMREADVTFANLEGVVHQYEGPPGGRAGGLHWTATHPSQLEDLKWMGIDMVSCANNHALDYGEWALMKTIEHLDRIGLVHAGTGSTLREARAAAYFDAPCGRVGLVSASDVLQYPSAQEFMRAGEQSPYTLGRPGINGLGVEVEYVVTRTALQHLRKLGKGLGFEERKAVRRREGRPGPVDTDTEYHIFGLKFVLGEAPTIKTRCNVTDKEDVIRQVKDAARQAEWVIVSLHAHAYEMDSWQPPAFVTEFTRACIDAGAHILAVHGNPHLRGIEIYQGRPIFHGLSHLVLQLDTVLRHPYQVLQRYGLDFLATPGEFIDRQTKNETAFMSVDPSHWRSILPVCRWESGKLKAVEIYPVDLGYRTHRGARGRPVLASPPLAQEIIADVQRLSEPFETRIQLVDNIGIIKV